MIVKQESCSVRLGMVQVYEGDENISTRLGNQESPFPIWEA